jgi:hypothetical protein
MTAGEKSWWEEAKSLLERKAKPTPQEIKPIYDRMRKEIGMLTNNYRKMMDRTIKSIANNAPVTANVPNYEGYRDSFYQEFRGQPDMWPTFNALWPEVNKVPAKFSMRSTAPIPPQSTKKSKRESTSETLGSMEALMVPEEE